MFCVEVKEKIMTMVTIVSGGGDHSDDDVSMTSWTDNKYNIRRDFISPVSDGWWTHLSVYIFILDLHFELFLYKFTLNQ